MNAVEKAVYRYSGGLPWNDSGEIMLVCPSCRFTGPSGDGKLSFNVLKGGGQCFHCGETFNATKLMKALGKGGGIHHTSVRRPTAKPIGEAVSSLGWSPLSEDESFFGKRARTYLRRRGFTEDMIKEYQLGIGGSERILGRIVFPVVNKGKLVYYQARLADDVGKPKYLNPSKGDNCLGSSEVVGFLDTIVSGAPIVLCEGILSSIGASKLYGLPGVCIFGKSLSETQRDLIALRKPSRVIILLDPDADQAFSLKAQRAFEAWGMSTRIVKLSVEDGDAWDLWSRKKSS